MAQVRIVKSPATAQHSLARVSETADSLQLASVGLGIASAAAGLAVGGASSPGLSGAGDGRIYFDSTSNTFKVSENGGAYTNLVGAGGGLTIGTTAITSGTVGRVLFEGTGNVLQESANLFWDNTNFRLSLQAGNTPSYILSAVGTAAQTFGMERHTTANTAGNNLTVLAGGATSGATDKAGGNLVLSGGTSTGTGGSQVLLQVATAGGTGTTDRAPATKVTLAGTSLALENTVGLQTKAVSPTSLSANQNNYAPGTGTFFRLTSSTTVNITGLTAGADGYIRTFVNIGSNGITFTHQDANSTAANRLILGPGASVTINGGQAISFQYDATTSRWRHINTALSAGGGATVSLGDTITGGNAGRILFEGAGPVFDDDAELAWDDTNKRLTVGGGTSIYDLGVIKSTNGDLISGVYNTDNAGTSARGVFYAYNATGYYAEFGLPGAGFTTSGALVANIPFLKTNGTEFRFISSGSFGFYPNGNTTSVLSTTSTEVSVPSGVNVVVGGGTGVYHLGTSRSYNGDLTTGSYNSDGAGTAARAVVAASNLAGYYAEIGAPGGGFTTSGALVANIPFLKTNGNEFRFISSGSFGFYPSSSATTVLSTTNTEVSVPSGVNFVVGGGTGAYPIHHTKSVNGDVIIAATNEDGAGTSAKSSFYLSNISGYYAYLSLLATGHTGLNGAIAHDALMYTNGGSIVLAPQSGGYVKISPAVRLLGSSSGYVGLQGAASAGSTTYTLPAADGSANSALVTNGSAVLSWSSKAYSELYYDNDTGTTITVTTAGTYYGFASSTLTVGVEDNATNLVGSATNNNFTVGTNGAGDYHVTAQISHVGPNNAVVHAAIAVNGTVVAKTRSERKQAGTAHSGMLSCSGILTLAATDTVDVRFTSDTNSDVITVYHANISAYRINK